MHSGFEGKPKGSHPLALKRFQGEKCHPRGPTVFLSRTTLSKSLCAKSLCASYSSLSWSRPYLGPIKRSGQVFLCKTFFTRCLAQATTLHKSFCANQPVLVTRRKLLRVSHLYCAYHPVQVILRKAPHLFALAASNCLRSSLCATESALFALRMGCVFFFG